jgi:PKD repeat protein
MLTTARRSLGLRVLVACAAVASFLTGGCTGRYESDFAVMVVNRTANAIDALANGSTLGQVAAGQTGSFSLHLAESNANIFSNGVAPTPQAVVTFTARDVRSGAVSTEQQVTLSKGAATYISFSSDDFPATGPTIARFTYSPTNPTVNQDVSMNGASSTVSNGTFAWDFGDGQTGTGAVTTHRYARTGTFTITMTVTSDTRQTSTASRTITVSATLPPTAANFTFSPTAPAINQDVSFIAATNQAQVPGATWTWDFGDGTSGTGPTVSHRYTRGGTFTVTLRVSTDATLSATSSRQITVASTLPAGSASFTASPTDPRVGDTVFFNATASTATGGTYAWDFGDGSTATGVTTTHVFTQARTFVVTLTVTNSLGQTATATRNVSVTTP